MFKHGKLLLIGILAAALPANLLLSQENEAVATPLKPKLITPIQAIVPISLRNSSLQNQQVVAKVQVNGSGMVEDLVILQATHIDLVNRAESLIRKALFDPGDVGLEEAVRFELILPFKYPSDAGMPNKSTVDDVQSMIDSVTDVDRSLALYSPNELDEPLKVVDQGIVYVPENEAGERIEGSAKVEFYVNQDGLVRLPRIVSSTDDEVALAAISSIRDMRFTPPLHDGRPAVTLVRMPFNSKAE
jgi:TonB family protein